MYNGAEASEGERGPFKRNINELYRIAQRSETERWNIARRVKCDTNNTQAHNTQCKPDQFNRANVHLSLPLCTAIVMVFMVTV